MQKYFECALFFDFLLALLICLASLFMKSIFASLNLPTQQVLNGFDITLITISATLIGFLLTIITVIVTFKKGFEDKNDAKPEIKSEPDASKPTVFERTISKEEQFYKTPIHKRVVNVFVHGTYEIGIVLLVLLILQLGVLSISSYWSFVISFCSLILIFLSIIRSLYIFKLFLNVHL